MPIQIQRLKDKLNNKSNRLERGGISTARAAAWAIGEEGRGIPTLIEMATYTRLDCALGVPPA